METNIEYINMSLGRIETASLNFEYIKQLIEYRNKFTETLFGNKKEVIKIAAFESICYVNYQIANYLLLPNVKTLDNLKCQLFEVELKNRSQEFSAILQVLEESHSRCNSSF